MSTRHRAREIALQILYRYDVAAAASASAAPALSDRELSQELIKHFEHFKIDAEVREFASELVAGSLKESTALDEIIEKHASNWKVARMAVLDRCLLRMATFELQRFRETPGSVVIDEAIELAKQFGTTESPGFVNGILDAIQRTVRTH